MKLENLSVLVTVFEIVFAELKQNKFYCTKNIAQINLI